MGCSSHWAEVIDKVNPWYVMFYATYVTLIVFAIIRVITAIFLKARATGLGATGSPANLRSFLKKGQPRLTRERGFAHEVPKCLCGPGARPPAPTQDTLDAAVNDAEHIMAESAWMEMQ